MPHSEVQIQSCEIKFVSSYQQSPFCSYGIVATHCLGSLFVLTNEGGKLMWKDMLIIIHLPSNYTPGLSGINHGFYFLLQQLASLQEQLDSLIEKWPPGGSLMSSSATHKHSWRGGGGEPSSREEGVFISWLAVSFLSVCRFHTLHIHHTDFCIKSPCFY